MSGKTKRTILHVDLDAFFCSVEELHRPELKDRPFVVGGSPQGRGVVASASYAARAYGIHSAMPTLRALRLCPELIVLHGKHADYHKHSKRIMAFLRDSAPLVEQLSIDEAFLDVSDDPLGGEAVAKKLQAEIDQRFKLPTSWGVAGNKLVAKVATEPVQETYEPQSMSAERTFSKDIADLEELKHVLFELSERVGARLRKAELAGKTVRLKLRWADFTTITRQHQLPQGTDPDQLAVIIDDVKIKGHLNFRVFFLQRFDGLPGGRVL
ncbi:MAG: DNA polymerase IV [Anaerolineales bacterium]